jgi:hypothetical protein
MSWPKRLFVAVSLFAVASSAAADPLTYQIQRTQADNPVQVVASGVFDVAFVPLIGEPINVNTFGSSNLVVRPSGTAVADVGLPDSFNGGTQEGIYIESFDAHFDITEAPLLLTNLFAPLVPLLPVPPPIPLAGAAALIDIADLDVSMVAPLSSNLISIPDPNEYHWGGVAGLRISGSLNLLIQIPGQDPIALGDPVPFEQIVNPAALAGTFSGDTVGDPTSTTLVVGVQDAEVDPDLSALIAEPLVIPLGVLGVITVAPQSLTLRVNGNVRAVNRQYGLPGSTTPFPPGAGCGIGPELAALMPVLGWLWRRRQRSA